MDYGLIGGYKYKDLERFTYRELESNDSEKRRKYVICYNPNEIDFDNLGIAVLNDCIIDPIIKQEINGDYSLSFTVIKDNRGKYKRVKPLCIIKAQGQLFRIPMWDGIKSDEFTLTINAKHLFYDTANLFIEDRRVQQQTAYETMSRLLEFDYTKRFRIGVSDVATLANANFIDQSVSKGIMDKVIPRWKGELLRDNFTISLKQSLGKYKPDIVIRYGKNASSISKKVDYTQLCTRLYATGNNGIDFASINDGRRYIDSLKINNYPPLVYPKKETFDADTKEELKQLAKDYLEEYDVPQITIDVEFIDLYENKEYENLKNAIKVDLGDTIRVQDIDLGIEEDIKCIAIETHAITGVDLKKTFGKKAPTIIDSMDDTEKKVYEVTEKVTNLEVSKTDENEKVNELIKSVDEINKSITNINKDTLNLSNRIGVLNSLKTEYKDDLVGSINELYEKIEIQGKNVNDVTIMCTENVSLTQQLLIRIEELEKK